MVLVLVAGCSTNVGLNGKVIFRTTVVREASGRWQVYISGADEIVDTCEETGTVTRKPLIGMKYQNPETSELVRDVNASTKVLDIEVDRAVP